MSELTNHNPKDLKVLIELVNSEINVTRIDEDQKLISLAMWKTVLESAFNDVMFERRHLPISENIKSVFGTNA